jgi:hypothetical protein
MRGDDDPPDTCSCDYSSSTLRTTAHPWGRLVRMTTDPDCDVHGHEAPSSSGPRQESVW